MSSEFIIEEWRDLWTYKSDYIFVCLAYIFSISNLQSLEDDMAKNGGGAYLVAYVASAVVLCLPLIMMELAVGQLTGKSPIQALGKICPIFKGVGIGYVLISLIVASMLGITIGYYGLYIVHLFLSVHEGSHSLHWFSCDNWWNKNDCSYRLAGTPLDSTYNNSDTLTDEGTRVPAAEDFYKILVQNRSMDIGVTGDLVWRPIAASGAAWLLVFFAIFLGVRWYGKVCYFTVVIPIVLLVGLIIRALTLEFMAERMGQLFKPDWDFLLHMDTWMLAFSRSLLAVGLCFGAYITLGSYSRRNNNMVGDSFLFIFLHLLVVGAQLLTSIGFRAAISNKWNSNVAAFLNFDPILGTLLTAMGLAPMPHLWSALLLFCGASLMLNTMYALTFTVTSAVEDTFFSRLGSRLLPRTIVSFLICCLGFAMGLGYTVQAGPHAFALMKKYLELLPFWVLLFFEILAIAWFYCGHMLGVDIHQMLSNPCSWCLGFALSYLLYILPVAPVYILVCKFMNYTTPDDKYEWVEPVGWVLAIIPILPIPLAMIYVLTSTCIRGPGLNYWEVLAIIPILPIPLAMIYVLTSTCIRGPGFNYWEVLAIIPILPIPLAMIYVLTSTCIRGPGLNYWEVLAIIAILPIPLAMIYVLTSTCIRGPGFNYWERFKYSLVSPLRYEIIKPVSSTRYASTSPGYILLPTAPLAEPEIYNENYTSERVLKVSNI